MSKALHSLVQLLVAMVCSLVIYVAASATILDKPITYGSITRLIERKVSYARTLPSPKLVLIGGSGVRTSHRCDVLGPALGVPCVNGGSTVGLGLNYLFEEYRSFLKSGDIVYIPLEYQQFLITRPELLTGPDAAILLHEDWGRLAGRGVEGFARAAFMVDLKYISESAIEQALAAAGVRARFDKQTATPQGDQTGLTHDAGRPFDAHIEASNWKPPSAESVAEANGAKAEIASFLDWCRQHGVRTIGGLPVAFADKPIPTELIEELRGFYALHGASIVILDNRSQYPRSYFFDSPFHLEEEHSIEHSLRLVEPLQRLIESGHRSSTS